MNKLNRDEGLGIIREFYSKNKPKIKGRKQDIYFHCNQDMVYNLEVTYNALWEDSGLSVYDGFRFRHVKIKLNKEDNAPNIILINK